MTDNFDSNVAKRKPNVTNRPRPVHPWDVQNTSINIEDVSRLEPSFEERNIPGKPYKEKNNSTLLKDKKTIYNKISPSPEKTQKKNKLQIPQKSNYLSDSININSNYCKLDNDVSDYLLCRLSPSAQSVYLRLYRQSFGWNRNWAAESLPKLTKACNLSLQTVRKAIKELETIGCIKKEFSDYHKATVYCVYLPSDIGISKKSKSNITLANNRGQDSNSDSLEVQNLQSQKSHNLNSVTQKNNSDIFNDKDVKNIDVENTYSGGQDSNIQSIFFSGTSIYTLLESYGSLPKNISKYITYTHLRNAVDTIDEFYDSIGFSIVSRTLYHKSLIDYFELIKSGFSHDDISYAVRWTFKKSRSRPESFSLIKHTMHLAMEDLIHDLKNVSYEKEIVERKQETLRKNLEWKNKQNTGSVTTEDMKIWLEIIDDLKGSLNEHSFTAFIEPLKLVVVNGEQVTLSSPPDSISWVIDHYLDRIEQSYREKTEKKIMIEIR